MEENITKILEVMKQEVYAPVKGIKFDEIVPYAAVSLEDYIIHINPSCYDELKKKGLSEEEISKAFLQHEYIGHIVYHPFDLRRMVAEQIELSDIGVPEGQKDIARNFFDDYTANLKVWNYHNAEELKELYRSLESGSKLDVLQRLFYQKVMSEDFGVSDERELEPYVEKLKEIGFLSGSPVKPVRECISQVRQFYRALEPLFKEESQKEDGKGSCQDRDSPSSSNRNGGRPFNSIPRKAVEKEVKKLVEDRDMSPAKAKRFLKQYSQEKSCSDDESLYGPPGGEFLQNPDIYADMVVYDALSEKYSLKIEEIPLKSNGGAYPKGYSSWGLGDSLGDVDPFTSYGVIVPGISKKVERGGMKTFGTLKGIPCLLLLLDDSGSMPKPYEVISPAVLASFVVSKSYIRRDSKVAPLRFSDRTTKVGFLRDEMSVLNELLKFKDGGDTKIDLDVVEEVVAGRDKSLLDAVIITDSKIENRSKAIDYFSRYNHAFMFEIGKEGKMTIENGVIVYPIGNGENISDIVIGKVL